MIKEWRVGTPDRKEGRKAGFLIIAHTASSYLPKLYIMWPDFKIHFSTCGFGRCNIPNKNFFTGRSV
jgi:hypothetical protein